MRSTVLRNKITGEQFVCDNINNVQSIDGLDYLLVRRNGTDRLLLMRKDVFEIVPARVV
jgi:hypothetical protein